MELNRVHEILSISFTKTIKEYKDIVKLLDPLLLRGFGKHTEKSGDILVTGIFPKMVSILSWIILILIIMMNGSGIMRIYPLIKL